MDNLDCIILAGGYAKRLRPLSDYIPKPLFPLEGVPILNYTLNKILELNPNSIIISINEKFQNHFKYWLKTLKAFYGDVNIDLSIEPSNSQENKLGAIGGLHYTIDKQKINSDLLVVLGDNLFNFDIKRLLDVGYDKIILGSYDIKNNEDAKRFGVLKVENNKIVEFYEKPENPISTIISIGIYYIPKEKLGLLYEYINNNKDKDSIGKLFEWILKFKKEELLTYTYNEGFWFDIGTLESYSEAINKVRSLGLYNFWIHP
ncbi:nucleotidyl transferase [Nanobdella aerobiophila]|uniref:Nucleotidyl transferase n=1 Tax=Nanobdella aerobiophila TaxID=2586965 RepID=A0A915SA90_9ARCH|nr:nucleotidyltransferase family protein [Nanobdella aerobiophila]BBL45592.1 nucleotidyl transferase [Nanobdella aerobiophila]